MIRGMKALPKGFSDSIADALATFEPTRLARSKRKNGYNPSHMDTQREARPWMI